MKQCCFTDQNFFRNAVLSKDIQESCQNKLMYTLAVVLFIYLFLSGKHAVNSVKLLSELTLMLLRVYLKISNILRNAGLAGVQMDKHVFIEPSRY